MNRRLRKTGLALLAMTVWGLAWPPSIHAGTTGSPLTLNAFIQQVLAVHISLDSSRHAIREKKAIVEVRKAAFFPKVSGIYEFESEDDETRYGSRVTDPADEFTAAIAFRQPVFTGFSNTHQYALARLDLDIAELNKSLVQKIIVLEAKTAYYTCLKAAKQMAVAVETEQQIREHGKMAESFYHAGKIPYYGLLQAEVELANAGQARISADNRLETAESRINDLLRRSLDHPVGLADDPRHRLFTTDVDACISKAMAQRTELKIADLDILSAKRKRDLASADYYPRVDLRGSYFRQGAEWDRWGGEGITNSDGWTVVARATWTILDWGARKNGRIEKRHLLARAENTKAQLMDKIRFQVRKARLNAMESGKNITTVEKAVDQATVNLDIQKERFRRHLATSTDVLDARTLLSRTTSNYYNALYDYKIALAELEHAIGE